ncbi:MAG: DUF4123 domain-containing protein [Bacteroidota bacterium]
MAGNINYTVILDAARLEHEIAVANELNPEGLSLYKGQPEEELSDVAPYLFSCFKKPEFQKWVLDSGWGKSWGVFAQCTIEFIDLHRHFRRFLMVKTEEGEQLYFRFYDPRVLRIFLPTCDAVQLREFFGPVSKFVCEDEDPAFALVFFHDNTKLITQRLPVKDVFGAIENVKPEIGVLNEVNEDETTPPKPLYKEIKEEKADDSSKEPETPPKNDNPDKPRRFKFYE